MSDIIVYNNRDPLAGYTRESFFKALKEKLEGRVVAGYVFGSLATNKLHAESDVDVMLIARTDLPFLDQYKEFSDILPEMDLLIYTPEEWNRLTTNPSPGFWRTVTNEMIKIA